MRQKDLMASPCCILANDEFLIKENDLQSFSKLRNNSMQQKLRLDLVEKNPENFCKSCVYCKDNNLDANISFDMLNHPEMYSELQLENLRLMKEEYETGAVELKSYPPVVFFVMGYKCNLNCPMCPQRIDAKDPTTWEKVKVYLISDLKPFLKRAMTLVINGGEPFLISEAIKLMEIVTSDDELKTLELNICSNMNFIDKYWDLLKKQKNITITVSPDSLEDTYEYIRRGAKWEWVNNNVKMFNKIAKENNLNWRINSANILMKSTINKIVEFAKWNIENNVTARFSILQDIGMDRQFAREEDLMAHPELLAEIDNWEQKMDKAIKLFKKAGQQIAVDSLTFYRDQIKANAKEEYKRIKINIFGIKISYKKKV